MAEDDVEVVIDAEMGGNAVAGLTAAANEAERLAAAMERARAAGAGPGGQTLGETPFGGPPGSGGGTSAAQVAALNMQTNIANQQALAQMEVLDVTSADRMYGGQRVGDMTAAQQRVAQQQLAAQDAQANKDADNDARAEMGLPQLPDDNAAHTGWRAQMHGMRMLAGGDANISKALMGGMGVSGRFGGAGVVGGGMEIATAGMSEISKFADIMGNSFMSTADKARAFTEALPIVGGFFTAVYGFVESMSGVADRLRQQQLSFDLQMAGQTAFFSETGKVNPIRVEQATADAAAAAAQNILPSYGAMPSFLNTQDYQAATAQNALEDRRVALERQQAAALAGLGTLQGQQPELNAMLAAAKQQEANVRERQKSAATASAAAEEAAQSGFAASYSKAGGAGASIFGLLGYAQEVGSTSLNKAGKDLNSKDLDIAADATAKTLELSQNNLNAAKEKENELNKIATEQGALKIDQLKQQLSIIEAQVNKAKSQYEGIGGMDAASRSNALLALQQAGSLGVQSLTEEQRGLIGSVPGGADKLKELYRDLATNDPNVAADVAALRHGVATRGTIDQQGASQSLDELLAAQAAKAAEIKTQTQANAVASAGDTSGTVKAFGDQLIAAIVAATASVKKHTEDKAKEKAAGATK